MEIQDSAPLNGSRHVNRVPRATVESYKPDDPENTAERFRITWPAGARVLDQRNKGRVVIGGEPRQLDDDAFSPLPGRLEPKRWGRWLILAVTPLVISLVVLFGIRVLARRSTK